MKRWVLVCLLVAMVTGVQAANKYRDFTDTQGRTITARIVSVQLDTDDWSLYDKPGVELVLYDFPKNDG